MKKLLILLLAALMLVSLCACGQEAPKTDDAAEAPAPSTEKATEAVTEAPTEPEPEPETEPLPTATEFKLNEPITLDFVEITFTETGIASDIRQSITSGVVTRISGPQEASGKQFIYLRGTIKNTDKKELPVYDFFLGEFDIDGYIYECSANQCDVIDGNGQTQSMLEPLTTYTFTMYAKIPAELANSHCAESFRFGFYDLFDNYELSSNRSFEDDPISLCPYQYQITLK